MDLVWRKYEKGIRETLGEILWKCLKKTKNTWIVLAFNQTISAPCLHFFSLRGVKTQSLWHLEQCSNNCDYCYCSCELLSKNCIFDILNSPKKKNGMILFVVNCFQKIVSLTSWTVSKLFPMQCSLLWIAFKKLYLWHLEQYCVSRHSLFKCCELLSKNCIFDILNSVFAAVIHSVLVVNCFQKIVSLTSWTV